MCEHTPFRINNTDAVSAFDSRAFSSTIRVSALGVRDHTRHGDTDCCYGGSTVYTVVVAVRVSKPKAFNDAKLEFLNKVRFVCLHAETHFSLYQQT